MDIMEFISKPSNIIALLSLLGIVGGISSTIGYVVFSFFNGKAKADVAKTKSLEDAVHTWQEAYQLLKDEDKDQRQQINQQESEIDKLHRILAALNQRLTDYRDIFENRSPEIEQLHGKMDFILTVLLNQTKNVPQLPESSQNVPTTYRPTAQRKAATLPEPEKPGSVNINSYL